MPDVGGFKGNAWPKGTRRYKEPHIMKGRHGMRIKKNGKRVLSGIMALAMMLSLLVSGVYVASASPEYADADPNALGEFELEIRQKITDKDPNFKATLTDTDNGKSYTVPLAQLKGENGFAGTYSGILEGTYTLTVTGNHYLTYKQSIVSQNDRISIKLYNDDQVNEGRAENQRFGVISLGDFNGDHQIDDADADVVRANIGKTDSIYDMDGDGDVDLVDLAYVVRNRNGNEQAILVHTASTLMLQKATVQEGENTKIKAPEGKSVAAVIFAHDTKEAVTLTPTKDEPISKSNPVEITAEIPGASDTSGSATEVKAEAITIAPPTNVENAMTSGVVNVTAEDNGKEVVYHAVVNDGESTAKAIYHTMAIAKPQATSETVNAQEVTIEKDGTVVINLGKKVAIKKVSIRVTGTQNGTKLAEIASVQFLGDFAERIAEPDLSIPTIDPSSVHNTEGEYKQLTFSWNQQTNVTGYEVSISGPGLNVVRSVAAADGTTYTFMSDSFNGDVDAFQSYALKVRSVSGSWRSDWSTPVNYVITCTSKPPTPEYMNAQGAVNGLKISWRALYDTEWWDLYYREKGSTGAYTEVKHLTKNEYLISGLIAGTEYEVYVVGGNRNGNSGNSQTVVGSALTAEGVKLPMFGLINRTEDRTKLSSDHITIKGTTNGDRTTLYLKNNATVNGALGTTEDWKVIADSDPNTYLSINDWDAGVVYGGFRGPVVTLDQKYTIGSLRIAPCETYPVYINQVLIAYKTEDGTITPREQRLGTSVYTKYDSQNRKYLEVIFDKPITTDYIEVHTTGTWGGCAPLTIAELGIYKYDPLMDDVHNLFTDESELTLKDTVTEDDIQALYTRLDTPDPETGETNPRYDVIKQLLDYAENLFRDAVQDNPITLDSSVTARHDGHLGFAQSLSDNQPLGYVAAAGETVVVYVSSSTESLGAMASLKFVVTQYHPEVSSWAKEVTNLKVGRNEIQIPSLTTTEKEKGGALYIYYNGNANAKTYTIRVKGAYPIPMLNVDGLTDTARTQAIDAYVTALEQYVPTIQELHNQHHSGGSAYVNYAYDETNCFFNSTEIVMENMFFSFPASQVLAGLNAKGGSSHEGRVQALADAIAATEQEVKLFYQFKGLNELASDTDRYPRTRLNIRYHQMFTGAFMYAGGKHIGIEWGSVPGLVETTPITTDDQGRKTGGGYSGWGVAHEIGHCINAAAYQRVEVTNNIFAQLAQTDETNKTFRAATAVGEDGPYTYEKVYKAVVAGNTGHTGDLGVQLGMYWQLHLAYDKGYSYKFYDTAEEQLKNLFYARVDSYFRNPEKADKAYEDAFGQAGIKLSLTGDADQKFMRVCCVAAMKDLLDFFRAWGFTPNEETVAYASQFDKEKRSIQFIDDDSRLYAMNGGTGMSAGTVVDAKITNAQDRRITDTNRVEITLGNTNTNSGAMLGYEIYRNDKLVAFVLASETKYTDIVATENNQAFVYKIIGVDKLLNETKPLLLDEVKVSFENALAKDNWTIETNMRSDADEYHKAGEGYYVEDEYISGATLLLDNKSETVYTGNVITQQTNVSTGKPVNTNAKSAEIIINLGGVQQVAALKVTPGGSAGIKNYTIAVSKDGTNWETVKSDTLEGKYGEQRLYFNKMQADGTPDPYMYVYDASMVKLTAVNQMTISLAEIDILGPTSDNVELVEGGFGKLKEDYTYDKDSDPVPAGTIVFYGTYKGDPAYSVVLLKDQNGNILSGDQVILAETTKEGYLGNTSDGSYLYWLVDPDTKQTLKAIPEGLTAVKAELYRVMDANNMTDERLTSTSLTYTLPTGELPVVEIKGENLPATVPGAHTASIADEAVPLVSSVYEANSAAYIMNDLMRISAYEQPVTFTYDHDTNLATVALFASDEPIAVHVAVQLTGTLPKDLQFLWDDASSNNVYRAHTLTTIEGGGMQLDIYVVAHSGALGSSSTPGEQTHTKVVSGVMPLYECEGTGGRIYATADKVDHVSLTYDLVQHDANLEAATVFKTQQEMCPHAGRKTEKVPADCYHTGYVWDHCTDCGTTFSKEILPALNHDFDDGVCTRCGALKYIYLDAENENLVYDGAAVSCTKDSTGDFSLGGVYSTGNDVDIIVTWHETSIDGHIGEELPYGAPKDAGEYWVKVQAIPRDGSASEFEGEDNPYEDHRQFVIAPAPYSFTNPEKGKTVSVGDPYPPDRTLEATGITDETVTGTLNWYLDPDHLEPAFGHFHTGGAVTLYWVFTPSGDETNYVSTTKSGSEVYTVEGTTSPLEIVCATSMTYGESTQIHVQGGGGTGVITYTVTSASGNGSATMNGNLLTATHAGTITVSAHQEASPGYAASDSNIVTITIRKATPSGRPDYTPITRGGHTLADAHLTQSGTFTDGNGNPVAGTLSWALSDQTIVTPNTAYEWVFTPNDTENYEIITGVITPWVVSGSTEPTTEPVPSTVPGTVPGTVPSAAPTPSTAPTPIPVEPVPSTPAPSAKVEVTTNEKVVNGNPVRETVVKPTAVIAKGVATVTISEETGDEIVAAALKNESKTVVVAPVVSKDAARVEVSLPGKTVLAIASKTAADLRIETAAASVTVPNHVLDNLRPSRTLTISVERNDNKLSLEVAVDGKAVEKVTGELRLEIPVTNCKPSTVVVLLKKDGTREVIRTALSDVENKKVIASVDGSVQLLIMDNHKDFADVPANAWYAEHVDFASSHELMNGDENGNFRPNDYATRGAIAALLYNLEHNPEAGEPVFPDTTAKDWYTNAVTWAATNGVVAGYGDGTFGANDNITREQMACILFNYANFKGLDTKATSDFDGFSDADSISGWAENAMEWAVSNGLIKGADGKLNPSGTATRAEITALLRNFCTYLAQ